MLLIIDTTVWGFRLSSYGTLCLFTHPFLGQFKINKPTNYKQQVHESSRIISDKMSQNNVNKNTIYYKKFDQSSEDSKAVDAQCDLYIHVWKFIQTLT